MPFSFIRKRLLNCQVPPVRSLLLALPLYLEQQELTRKINGMNAKIHIQQKNVEKLRLQKLSLMQDLLTGKVAVTVAAPTTEATA